MKEQTLYLNHAGTSWPKPRAVTEAVQEAMTGSPSEWDRKFEEAHQALASFLGVSNPEQLLLTPGCTSALAVGIGDSVVEHGRRVLTSRWEHHALHRPVLKLANAGVQVDYIAPQKGSSELEHSQPLDLNLLEHELSKGDVALVAITAACNVTGELLPYAEVIDLAHQYGAKVLIDAAQIVGWVKLDLSGLGADMVAFGGHKGLQAPWGIGGLYVSQSMQMECTSASCTLPEPGQKRGSSMRRPGYCDVGSVDQSALAGLYAAIRVFQQQDMEANLARARRQIQHLRQALVRISDVNIVGRNVSDHCMPTLALSLSSFSSAEVAARLKQHSVIVGSGLQCAPLAHQTLNTQDSGLVRFSVGVGQPDKDIDEAIERLQLAFNTAL